MLRWQLPAVALGLLAARTGEASVSAPPCALVLLPRSGSAAPTVTAFCSSNANGLPCAAARSGVLPLSKACDIVDEEMYIQRAVYFAAGRDADGHRRGPPLGAAHPSLQAARVHLSAGVHTLSVAQSSWYPFGAWTGLHIPSGVLLSGSSAGSTVALNETCIRAGSACISSATPLDNMVLVSDYRVGSPNMSVDELFRPAVDAAVESVVLHGAGATTVNGIAAQGEGIQLTNVTISNVTAGISGGYFCQFIASSNSSSAPNQDCDGNGWCEARRVELSRARVTGCHVDASLQGITIIGKDSCISNNTIVLSHKTWISPNQVFGIGMGVSAGFVGTRNISVSGNRIIGGEYVLVLYNFSSYCMSFGTLSEQFGSFL